MVEIFASLRVSRWAWNSQARWRQVNPEGRLKAKGEVVQRAAVSVS